MKLQHNIITRAVLARTEANMVMVMTGKRMIRNILAMLLIASLLASVDAGSNFADSLAECSAVQELNICLREVVIGVGDGGADDGGGGYDGGVGVGDGGGDGVGVGDGVGDGVAHCCSIFLCYLGCEI